MGSNNLWIVGFVFCVLASLLSTMGVNLQKFSHLQQQQQQQDSSTDPAPYYRDYFWWAGFFLIVFGTLLDVVALAFAAQSLIAPLAGLTLVFNILIAPCFLKEQINKWDILATAVIIAGCTTAVAFADHEHTVYDFDEIVDKANTPEAWTYFFGSIVAMIATYFLILRFESQRIDQTTWYVNWSEWHAVSYAFLAATAGAIAVTSAKAGAEIVKGIVDDGSTAEKTFKEHWFAAPAAIIVLIVCLIIQIHYLNMGLQRFDVLLVLPMYQGFWIILTAIAGMVAWREFDSFSLLASFMFPLGVVITVIGVGMMTQRPSPYSEILQTEDDHTRFPINEEGSKATTSLAQESETRTLHTRRQEQHDL